MTVIKNKLIISIFIFTIPGICYAESSDALQIESDRVGNIFPAEKGMVRLVLPKDRSVASGTITLKNEQGRELQSQTLRAGTGPFSILLPSRGYYEIVADIKYTTGESQKVKTSAAVIGPLVPEAVRLASPYGGQYNNENLGLIAGSAWDRGYFMINKDKYRKRYEAGFPLPKNIKQTIDPMHIFWCAIYQPLWLQDRKPGDPEEHQLLYPMKDRKVFRDLITYAIRTFSRKVEYLETCNEPGGHWKGTPKQFVEYHADMRAAAHKADPNIQVIGPSICNLDPRRLTFLDKLVKAGLLDAIDGLAVHVYVSASPPEKEFLRRIRSLKKYLADHGKPNFPIYVTEYGWTIPPGDWQKPVTPLTQAQYCARSLMLLQIEGIKAFSWFKMYAGQKIGGSAGYGILNGDFTPRPGYAAYANLTRCLAGTTGTGRILNLTPTTYLALFARKNDTVAAVWNTNGPADVILPDNWRWARDMMGRPVTPGKNGNFTVSPSPIYLEYPTRAIYSLKEGKPLRVAQGKDVHLPLLPQAVPAPLQIDGQILKVPADAPAGRYLMLARKGKNWQAASVEVASNVELLGHELTWPADSDVMLAKTRVRSHLKKPLQLQTTVQLEGVPSVAKTVTVQPNATVEITVPLSNLVAGRRYVGRMVIHPKNTTITPISLPMDLIPVPCVPTKDSAQRIPLDKNNEATLEMSYNSQGLHLRVTVKDEDHINSHVGKNIWLEDSLQFAFDMDAEKPWVANVGGYDGHFRVYEYGVALSNNKPVNWRWISYDKSLPLYQAEKRIRAAITRKDGYTNYRILLPWKVLGLDGPPKPGTSFGFAMVVNDTDAKGKQKTLTLFDGIAGDKSPYLFGRVWIR